MSEETAEIFQGMREARRAQHREWHVKNREVLRASGLTWRESNRGECLQFHVGGVRADFYPSTGRWRCGIHTRSGGAAKFIAWIREQTAKASQS